MTRKSFWAAAASVGAWLSLAACSGQQGYLYTPSTTTLTSAEPAQSRTADYPFPPDSPQGDIRLATSGLAKVSADAPTAVQLRMIVRNRSQQPWIIDPREQKLVLVAKGDQRTLDATASSAGPALVEVLPQQSATIDLSFDLPPTTSKPSEIPAFDAVWTVHVGERPVTTKTTFERLVAPSVARDVPTAGYPFYRGTSVGAPIGGERLPGTPDSKWTETQSLPDRGLY
jgi:hypothetical protein